MKIKILFIFFFIIFLSKDSLGFKDYQCGPSLSRKECKECCSEKYPNEITACEQYCFEGTW